MIYGCMAHIIVRNMLYFEVLFLLWDAIFAARVFGQSWDAVKGIFLFDRNNL